MSNPPLLQRLRVVLLACLVAAPALADGGTPGGPGTDLGGWTVLNPSSGSRLIYVSSSSGNDANSGLSPSAPKRTIAGGYALLRDRSPDWLLLRCGDIWYESFPGWSKSGASSSAMMVVTSYSTGERPRIYSGSQHGIMTTSGSGTLDDVAIVGLAFRANTWNGSGGDLPSGIFWLRGGTNLLIEDCKFERYSNNVVIQGYWGVCNDVRMRRCVLSDPLRTDAGNTNCYFENCNGILLEENVITSTIANENAGNKLSHNVYLHESCARNSATLRGNLVYNGRTNLSVRCGGLVEDNLVIRGGQGIQIGYAGVATYVPAVIRRNVITESRNHWDGQPLGTAIVFDRADGVDCGENIIHRSTSGSAHVGLAIGSTNRAMTIHDNVIYDWQQQAGESWAVYVAPSPLGPITGRSNDFQQPVRGGLLWHEGGMTPAVSYQTNREYAATNGLPFFDGSLLTFPQWQIAHELSALGLRVSYPDPNRSPGRYSAEVAGGGSGTESLITLARQQSRSNWRADLMAHAVSVWIAQGFGRNWGGGSTGCPADLNQNGIIDVNDSVFFQSFFAAGDLRADFDHNGVLNVNDFIAYQVAAALGCN